MLNIDLLHDEPNFASVDFLCGQFHVETVKCANNEKKLKFRFIHFVYNIDSNSAPRAYYDIQPNRLDQSKKSKNVSWCLIKLWFCANENCQYHWLDFAYFKWFFKRRGLEKLQQNYASIANSFINVLCSEFCWFLCGDGQVTLRV